MRTRAGKLGAGCVPPDTSLDVSLRVVGKSVQLKLSTNNETTIKVGTSSALRPSRAG
jgi:hypothetical protein